MAPSAMPTPAPEGPLTTAAFKNTLSKITSPTSTAPSTPSASPLDASLLRTSYTTSPRAVPAADSPLRASQEICTDHMITAQWTSTTGWQAPQLKPYGPLSLMPTASCLHYATECFEGLKLYRGFDGRLRLFRPDRNVKRMLVSAARIALPAFDPFELLKLIVKLCAVDGAKWLPNAGEFLYIRPTMIADDAALGVQQPKSALLYVLLACFPRMDMVDGGMRLLASEEDTVRAWPGGFGYAKVGANYGPSLAAQGEARRRGFQQVLWLLGRDGEVEVTEAGASNFFVVWKTKSGEVEMVTAPLGQRVILDGVTRRSVLELAETRLSKGAAAAGLEKVDVQERKILMREIVEAVDEGRMIEAFAVGTAFFVSAVSKIHYQGRDLAIPMKAGESGVYTKVLKSWMWEIMYGKVAHEWGYVVDEE